MGGALMCEGPLAVYSVIVSQIFLGGIQAPEIPMDCGQNVAGLDIGLTLLAKTAGVCRTGSYGEVLTHTYSDRLSRAQALGDVSSFSALAIDAPVLAPEQLHYEVRSCEKVFVWGEFQKRCKPGESHVRGTGQALRRAGVETAHSFAVAVSTGELARSFPRVFDGRNIVEAFPDAFLGVSLKSTAFDKRPVRGEKFDWLYSQWLREGVGDRLRPILAWEREAFWTSIKTNIQHDERAALVCALTAICVVRGRYVAVGESDTGFFFLPPWELWQAWARRAVDTNRAERRLDPQVEVWIDGVRFSPREPLPRSAAG